MRQPPVAFALFAVWAALVTSVAAAAFEESILEAAAAWDGGQSALPVVEREGYKARLVEGPDELEEAVGDTRRVTKRHGDSQVRS